MSSRPGLVAVVAAGLLVLACEPPDEAGPSPAGGETGGSTPDALPEETPPAESPGGSPQEPPPGGGDGSSGDGGLAEPPGPTDPATASVTFSLESRRLPPGSSRLDVEVVALALFVDADPTYRNADTPCDGGGRGALLPLETTVTLAPGVERRPLASLEHAAGGELREVWLVLRQGFLHTGERVYKVHAGAMCVLPDGLQYALVRLRPRAPATLAAGAALELVAQLDGREQIEVARVDCRVSAADECRDPDDEGDDRDPDTRLRYAFAPQFPVRVEEAR